jgi:CheY-like chemotaxis protein
MKGTFTRTPLRVLVVDDCHDTTDSLATLLGLWGGYDVSVAYDGPGALEAARGQPPDIVLLDIKLGTGMDGYDVARLLRAQNSLKDALLVCITGYGMDADRRRARQAGFNQHLTKPFDPNELEGLLATWKPPVSSRALTIRCRSESASEFLPAGYLAR